MQIKFEYQVKKPIPLFSNDTRERYEVKVLFHECDPNKSDRENLDDAFIKACELGAEPNKQVRWKFLERFDISHKELIEKNLLRVVTKSGFNVRIICWNRKCAQLPILALVDVNGVEEIVPYRINGVAFGDDTTCPMCLFLDKTSE